MLELRYYVASDGGSPFEEWFTGLNVQAAAKVAVTLARLEQGNLSNVKSVGEGVLEYRIDWGPGYRVYFGRDGDTLVIDSVGFKDRLSWIDDDAHPHSDAMHVVERWRRIDQDHLDHTVRVEDPKFYTKPWTFHRVFTHMPPGQEVMEYACDENNLDRDSGRLGFGPHEPSKYPGVQ